MKKTKITALLLTAVLCVGLLVGCGGSGSPSTGSDLPPATPPASSSDLGYVTEKDELIIGYTDFEPMNYVGDNGELTGFDTEFAKAVCEKLGVEPNFVIIDWGTKEVELNAKSIDCIWNGMTINPGRAESMSISLPYVKNAQVIVVKADSSLTSTADLIGKSVVAEVGSAGELQIIGDEEEEIEPEENLAQANYIPVAKQTDCLLEVKAGTAYAAVLDLTLAMTMVGAGTSFSDLKMIEGLELGTEEYGIAFRKGSDITARVDEIIRELVADGTLKALAEKYGLLLSPEIDK